MELSFVGVFIAGLVSFFSPCVVPLIPMYVGFLAGDLEKGSAKGVPSLYLNAFGFLVGLMGVFIALGAVASTVGGVLLTNQEILRRASGILIALLGVFQMGLFKISFLTRTRQMRVRYRGSRFMTAVLMGMAFSFGWTPCVGPILASVLLYAASQETLTRGILLLIAYSLGFIVPFVASTLLMERVGMWLDRSQAWLEGLKKASGALMVVIGILIYTNYLSRIIGWLS